MTRRSPSWPSFEGGRPPGVFVIDADPARRHATMRLVATSPELRVVGDHPGSAGAVPAMVRSLPHLCVVGPRVLSGSAHQLIADVERALPATSCIRTPKVIGLDVVSLTTAQQARRELDLVEFLSEVHRLVGLSVEDLRARLAPVGPVTSTRSTVAQCTVMR